MLTLREEILNLLESPELLEYLLSNPERLCEFDYANIIAGAPIGLAEKRALLEKLKNSAELTALLTALIMRHLRSLREGQSANIFRSAVTAIGVICTGR